MARRILIALLVPVLALSCSGPDAESPKQELLAGLVPDSTFFYLSIPNDPQREEEYRKSNLHKLVNHPSVKRFIEPLESYVSELIDKDENVKQAAGLSIREFMDLLGGPLVIAVFEVEVPPPPGMPKGMPAQAMPNVVLSIEAENTDKLKQAAEKVKKALAAQPGWEIKEEKVLGQTVYSAGSEMQGFHYTLFGHTIVASLSRAHLESLISRKADGAAGSLAENARFKKVLAKASPDGRHLALAYIALGTLWDRFRDQVPPEAQQTMEKLGVTDLTAIGMAVEYDLPQMRERYVLLTEHQDRGIVKFLAGKPGKDPGVSYVPATATSYFHGKLSLADLFDTVKETMDSDPDMASGFDEGLKEFQGNFGFDLRKDLLGSIGSSFTVYSGAAGKQPGQAEVVALIELEDPKAFFGCLDKMIAVEGTNVKKTDIKGTPVYSIGLSPPGGAPADAPPGLLMPLEGLSVVLFGKDKRLFVGMTPETPEAFVAKAAAPGKTILENPRFSGVFAKAPKDMDAFMLYDLGESVGPALEALNALPPEFSEAAKDPRSGKSFIDPERMPKAETLKSLLGVALTFKRTDSDAIVMESISDVGSFSVSGLFGAGVAAALILPATTKAMGRARTVSCADNLSQLWEMQNIYMFQYGGRLKEMPSETGSAFWLALTKTSVPIIDESNYDLYICPVTGGPPRRGFTSYRGPTSDVNTLDDGAIIGCCEPGNHPDGSINVLRKSGDVVEVRPGDPLFIQALQHTKR